MQIQMLAAVIVICGEAEIIYALTIMNWQASF